MTLKLFELKRTAGILLAGMMAAAAHAAIVASPAEIAQKRQWVQQHLLTAANLPPFSFTYGGNPSSRVLPSWVRAEADTILDPNRTKHVVTWNNGVLQVRCEAIEYGDYPVVEWTVYLKNIGTGATPILQSIQGLDTSVLRTGGSEFVLNCNKGDFCAKDSYEPYQITLSPSSENSFAPSHIPDPGNDAKDSGAFASGKSCDGPKGWPYFNLQVPDGGIILAIGWPGQWASSFARDATTGLRITAGQQLTHLYLKPGEEIRTPLIAMLFWQGADVARAQNIWRHWYIADNEPRVEDQLPQPAADIGFSGFLLSGGTEDGAKWNEKLEAGNKLSDSIFDARGVVTWWPNENNPYHKTAEWPSAEAWWNTGTWEVDSSRFPHGLKPFSEDAHAHGMTFMVWFEPERVGSPNSWLGQNHPEWLLPTNALTYGIHPSYDPILDEGNPAALNWLISHIDQLIKSQGIDVYREDMNGAGPCTAWRKNDAKDRQGITENLYVQGHLAFWDELRRRNPHLRIDSCASGGRRNDLETMRRGESIGNRSDFMFKDMADVVEGNQGQTYGLSSWLPFQGSGCPFQDAYSYRSFYLASFGFYVDEPGKHVDLGVQRRAFGEWRKIASYLLGDYYPLTSYSLRRDQWLAWQFDRPDLGGGEVQAFRRPKSPDESARFKLYGLDATATYEVENLDGGRETRTGSELMATGLAVTATTAPAALVFTYKRLE